MNSMPNIQTANNVNSSDGSAKDPQSKADAIPAKEDTLQAGLQSFGREFSATPATQPEKKDELHRRVTERLGELEKSLANLTGAAKDSEHAGAIRSEIAIAEDIMSGGWDHVGEVEAARLSQWLDNNQYLIGGSYSAEQKNNSLQNKLPAADTCVTDKADKDDACNKSGVRPEPRQ